MGLIFSWLPLSPTGECEQAANGIDFDEVEEREGVKSTSRHITFDEDKDDPEKIAKCTICFHRAYIPI